MTPEEIAEQKERVNRDMENVKLASYEEVKGDCDSNWKAAGLKAKPKECPNCPAFENCTVVWGPKISAEDKNLLIEAYRTKNPMKIMKAVKDYEIRQRKAKLKGE